MVDLTRLSTLDPNHHVISETACQDQTLWKRGEQSTLLVHQYMGTYEQYTAIHNVTHKVYQTLARQHQGHEDKSIVGWWTDFVQLVRKEQAKELLKGAEQLEGDVKVQEVGFMKMYK